MSNNLRGIRSSLGDHARMSTEYHKSGHVSSASSPVSERRTSDHVKHRKVPQSVTKNACISCKKARAKCDGRTPCKRCANRPEAGKCTYEIQVKLAKEDLVKQIIELQGKEAISQQILHALAADLNVQDILEMLQGGEPLELIVESIQQMTRPSPGISSPISSSHPVFEEDEMEDAQMEDAQMEDADVAPLLWTTVTSDRLVLDHLFQLYFAWIHPVHTLFDERQFVRSYHARDPHPPSYCASVLVNALCAMACHLHLQTDSEVLDFARLGDDFSEAFRTSIDPEDTHLTTVQALGTMFLVELAQGNGLRASSYLQIAIACLSKIAKKGVSHDREVWDSTVRGIHHLNVEWAQLTFQVPAKTMITPMIDGGDALTDEGLDGTRWYFYTAADDPVPSRFSLQTTTAREKAKLITIVQDVTITLYSQRGPPISAQHIMKLYARLVDWRSGLPTSIAKLGEQSHEGGLPHVLSLLILYSNTIIQLFRPLLSYQGFPTNLIEDIVWSQAQQGFTLLEDHYKRQFTCRCQPVLQMYYLLHFAEAIAHYFPGGIEIHLKDGPGAIKAAINILEESSATFPVAGIMQEMLRKTAIACSIRISSKLTTQAADTTQPKIYCMDDFIQACTRTTYVQPVEEICQRFAQSLIADWLAYDSGRDPLEPALFITPPNEEDRTHGSMQIGNLLNSG